MPLPNILEFIGTNITQRKFQQAMDKLLNFTDELDKRQSATANGYYKSYATLSAANADIANIPLGVSVKILSAENGGDYYKATEEATSLTKSPYDPATQAINTSKNYADTNKIDKSDIQYSYANGNLVGSKTKEYEGGINGTWGIEIRPAYASKVIRVMPGDRLFILNNLQNYAQAQGYGIAFFDKNPLIETANRITDTRTTEIDPTTSLTYLSVIVPTGAKFLVFNTKFNATVINWAIHQDDFSSSYDQGVETVYAINNVEVQSPLLDDINQSVKSGESYLGDIYDSSKLLINKYLTTAGILSNSTVAQNWKVFSFAVQSGETYYLRITSALTFPFKVVYSKSLANVDAGSFVSNVILQSTDQADIYKLTVPDNIEIKAVFMNVELVNGTTPTIDLRSTLSIQKNAFDVSKIGVLEKVQTKIDNKKIVDEGARQLIAQASGLQSRLKDKKVFSFGDSITQGTQGGYIKYLEQAFDTIVNNYGSSGAKADRMVDIVTAGQGLTKRDSSTASTVWQTKDWSNLDCVTIMIGTNESSGGDKGTISEIPTDTIYQHLDNPTAYFESFPNKMVTNIALCIEYIKWKAPKTEIHLITPPYRYGSVPQKDWLIPHLEAVARYYAVHLIYGTYESGISIKGMRGADNIYSYDDTHFNEHGNEVFGKFVAQKVLNFG